jgi:hypothetical protein
MHTAFLATADWPRGPECQAYLALCDPGLVMSRWLGIIPRCSGIERSYGAGTR